MIGRILRNRYEVQALLGEGSTAIVYRGLDRRLGRVVALKVLLPHVREAVRIRFMQEATAVAQLNHPNIMAIYDMDEDGEAHFLVIEYVEGAPLTDYIPCDVQTVVKLGSQIALALHYAHERDIIHRDIKPANIKVTPEGQIKIMDLGLALPKEAKRVTTAGMIIGTPAYLSPEQAQALELDRRTDIYSLGVVLYEMLTGQLPFSSDDINALLLQHVKQAVPSPRSINPELPLALETVIMKALEKQPARRYQTAETFAQALYASVFSAAGPDRTTQPARPVILEGAISQQRAPLRLILADDHTLLRRTLAGFLSEREDMVVVGEAADGEAALVQTLALQPDVLLLDLNMPVRSGLEVLPQLRAEAPNVKILILSGREEDWYITQALRAGAHGYVLKSASDADLVEAILRVAQGSLVLGAGVAEKVVTGILNAGQEKLSETERQILLLIAAGYENDAISKRLNLSMAAMIEALAHAMDILQAKDRHAAALAAIREGYILLDELQSL